MYHYLLLFALLCTCGPATLLAQRTDEDPKISLSNREKNDLIEIVAANEEYVPCSVIVTFELENMVVMESRADTLVLAPRSDTVLYTLKQINPKKGYGYGYTYQFAHGDYRKLAYDTNYVYELPFAAGTSYRVAQGYNGRFSHAGEAALDFSLPEGTPVHVARSGTVVRVVDKYHQHCDEPRCADFNNTIEILHDDGTYADYVHLRQRGTTVTVGQQVATGNLIGYSGDTGYASGPHLHFGVYRQGWAKREHLPTVFRVAGSAEPVSLLEGDIAGRPE